MVLCGVLPGLSPPSARARDAPAEALTWLLDCLWRVYSSGCYTSSSPHRALGICSLLAASCGCSHGARGVRASWLSRCLFGGTSWGGWWRWQVQACGFASVRSAQLCLLRPQVLPSALKVGRTWLRSLLRFIFHVHCGPAHLSQAASCVHILPPPPPRRMGQRCHRAQGGLSCSWMWLPDLPFPAGLWSLSYEQELTTPLHITASRGYTECLRLLLRRGAAVNFAPGGKTALHEACAAARTDCVRLLLSFGADPEAVSEDGYKPLHLCKSPDSLE